jgi:putative copper resistance protein D
VLHLLTAGIWVGALIPLSFLVLDSLRKQTEADARASYAALEVFSGVGPAVVSVLILTGLLNSWFLVGFTHWPELFTSFYGLTLLVKLVLFGAMLVLAAGNRFWLVPQLSTALRASGSMRTVLRALRKSVVAETGLAFLVLFAVALLGTLEPPGSP